MSALLRLPVEYKLSEAGQEQYEAIMAVAGRKPSETERVLWLQSMADMSERMASRCVGMDLAPSPYQADYITSASDYRIIVSLLRQEAGSVLTGAA